MLCFLDNLFQIKQMENSLWDYSDCFASIKKWIIKASLFDVFIQEYILLLYFFWKFITCTWLIYSFTDLISHLGKFIAHFKPTV